MKQKDKTEFSESIEGIQLFRDDIEHIISRLTKHDFKIEIQDSDIIYDNLDEILKLKGPNPKKLYIRGTPSVPEEKLKNQPNEIGDILKWTSIDIKGNHVHIFSRGSEKIYTFGFELKDFLKTKVKWHYKVFNPLYIFYLSLICIAVCSFNIDKKTDTIRYSWLIWMTGTVVIINIASLINRFVWPGIILTRKHEYGFWNRNKDKILVGIITGLASLIAGIIIGRLTDK
ncbi:MAG: hypothetical protein HYR67_05770 [Bacteroidetes bacterium]|nr:hypothetical protein [Bacteroidota bacterium]